MPAEAQADALSLLVAGMAHDPLIRWLALSPAQLFRPVVLEASRAGLLDVTPHGAAVWSWVEGDGTPAPPDRGAPSRVQAYATLLADRRPAGRDHLVLELLAVHPAARGGGIGTRLLTHGTRRADRAGLGVHLEASTPRTARLYERHGFVPTAPGWTLPDGGPTLLPMWREPAPGGRDRG